MSVVLVLGSAPMAAMAADWPRDRFDHVVAINNAWRVRPDWSHAIFPWDFPEERHPIAGPGQRLVTETDFVPAQNGFGGFVYAGGTMAFTASYWALAALRPRVIAVYGCDMEYPVFGPTHFYGSGTADPLRPDVTLRSLEAKSARLLVLAAMQGCAMVNLSEGPSRLIFPRVGVSALTGVQPMLWQADRAGMALAMEAELGYVVASGRYWEEAERFDPGALDQLDALWRQAASPDLQQTG